MEAIHKETGYRNLRGLESKIPKPAAGDDLLEAEGSAISFKTCLKPPAGAVWITLERELAMTGNDDFRLEWHGNTVVITPAANVEQMPWDVIEQAAEIVMAPLKAQSSPMAVFDLSEVKFFGSAFLALLLRCHTAVKSKGGELVLCGPSKMARELLKLTALDTLWAIYATKPEAIAAVDS